MILPLNKELTVLTTMPSESTNMYIVAEGSKTAFSAVVDGRMYTCQYVCVICRHKFKSKQGMESVVITKTSGASMGLTLWFKEMILNRDGFASKRTSANVWRHCCLSQLREKALLASNR